jgi:hypothetical protein
MNQFSGKNHVFDAIADENRRRNEEGAKKSTNPLTIRS